MFLQMWIFDNPESIPLKKKEQEKRRVIEKSM